MDFLFSVKYEKPRCTTCFFFHLNFLNVQGILAQKIYDAHAIFHHFSDVKNGGQSQQPSILCQLISGEPQHTKICRPKESLSYLMQHYFQ